MYIVHDVTLQLHVVNQELVNTASEDPRQPKETTLAALGRNIPSRHHPSLTTRRSSVIAYLQAASALRYFDAKGSIKTQDVSTNFL